MNQKTLDLIHEKYQESLRKSSNILEIVKNLYNLSKDEEVDSADANVFSLKRWLACMLSFQRKYICINKHNYIHNYNSYVHHNLVK